MLEPLPFLTDTAHQLTHGALPPWYGQRVNEGFVTPLSGVCNLGLAGSGAGLPPTIIR